MSFVLLLRRQNLFQKTLDRIGKGAREDGNKHPPINLYLRGIS